ncbi:GlsB/YeaQ/YmgE family stress response membrane protein [Arthrobacter sp. MDB2-24]
MSFIGFLILGLIAGALAKLIMPGKQGGGILITMLLGVIGAFLGGFIGGSILGVNLGSTFSLMSILFAVIGALIVLAIYGAVTKRRGSRV